MKAFRVTQLTTTNLRLGGLAPKVVAIVRPVQPCDVRLRLIPDRMDFRLARNATARRQLVNHAGQGACQLGE
jgi:hypothetical protein